MKEGTAPAANNESADGNLNDDDDDDDDGSDDESVSLSLFFFFFFFFSFLPFLPFFFFLFSSATEASVVPEEVEERGGEVDLEEEEARDDRWLNEYSSASESLSLPLA